MTPKEKAEELFYKFSRIIPPSSYVAYEDGVKINFDLENAKTIASITVDELIEEAYFTDGYYDRQEYWEEVKQEIEKL